MKEKALKRYAHFISILLNIVCIVFGVLALDNAHFFSFAVLECSSVSF